MLNLLFIHRCLRRVLTSVHQNCSLCICFQKFFNFFKQITQCLFMLLLLTSKLSDFTQQASHLIFKFQNRFFFRQTGLTTNRLKWLFFEVYASSCKLVSYIISSRPSLDQCNAFVLVFKDLDRASWICTSDKGLELYTCFQLRPRVLRKHLVPACLWIQLFCFT